MSEGEQAVFFENTSSWGGTIKCYVWNGGTTYAGGWPGGKMTYLGNNVWKWTYTGTAKIPATAGVIFSSGSQTDDFTWVNGGYYNASGYVKTIEGAGEIEDPDPVGPTDPQGPFTVYFDNSASNWSSVYVYMWDGEGEFVGKWPGTQMTETATVDGKTMLSYTYTPSRAISGGKIIFNNGSGSQTKDLEIVAGGIYTASGLQGSTGVNDVTAAADITVGVSGGKLIIRADRHANVTVTRADGVSFTLAVRPGINSFELARGFYIVNRTKVIL